MPLTEPSGIKGRVVLRGAPDYEQLRRDMVWQAVKPNRFPEAIVSVVDAEDVAAAVRWAAQNNLQVGARSGGHAWTGSSVRNNAITLDLRALNKVELNKGAMTAKIGPAALSKDIDATLAKEGVFFPTGHNPTVGIGGYILGDGHGWLSRKLGEAPLSVVGVDLVNAKGEIIYADAETNTDFFWAVRGSGPGFFAVVTCFHVRVYAPRPAVVAQLQKFFPLDMAEDVLRWQCDVRHTIADEAEFNSKVGYIPDPNNKGKLMPGIAVACNSFGASPEEAVRLLQPLVDCPFTPMNPDAQPSIIDFNALYAYTDAFLPKERSYGPDNMWSSAAGKDLAPALMPMINDLPNEHSFVLWFLWRSEPAPEDAALSSPGDQYICAYATWDDPAEADRCRNWAVDHMKRLEPLATGSSVNEENHSRRFFKPLPDHKMKRLEELRAKHDPEGRFVSFLQPTDTP